MKIKIKSIVIAMSLVATVVLLLNSCVNEPLISDNKPLVTTGKIKIPLFVDIPQREQVQTRSDDELVDEQMYVLVFDENNVLYQVEPVDIMRQDERITSCSVMLEASEGRQRTIYVAANLPELDPSSTVLEIGTSTIDDMVNTLTAKASTNGTVVRSFFIEYTECAQPMISSALVLPDGISSQTIINRTGMNDGSVLELIRTTVKVTATKGRDEYTNAGSLSRFHFLGITLGNVPIEGYVLSSTADRSEYDAGYCCKIGEFPSYESMPVDAYEDGSETYPIYCYETAAKYKPYVIIKARYDDGLSGPQIGYYKVDLVRDGEPMDLNRNTWYTIIVQKVLSYGYPTAEEAIANKPAHLIAQIVVRDSDSHDIVSNGQYYLGVSNSEYVVYDDGYLSGLEAVTVTTDAPFSLNREVLATPGIIVHGSTFDYATKIFISIINYTDSGVLTFKVGNLIKRVTIVRKRKIHAVGEPLFDFAGPNYVAATMIEPASWLQFATNISGTNASQDIANPEGGIYVLPKRNIGSDTSPIPAEAYFSRTGALGRVKVRFTQGAVKDVKEKSPAALNTGFFMYVGAFWKRNQTGERLIRIPRSVAGSSIDGDWEAYVLEGEDWIVLDDMMTTDHNVGWRTDSTPVEENVHNGNDMINGKSFDEVHPVTGGFHDLGSHGSKLVQGRVYGFLYNQDIYFRIGLKSQYTSANGFHINNAPARYGIVVLTYNNNQYTQRIFIRQGEDPDYLYRDGDNYEGQLPYPLVQGSRKYAARFSPYNLTDPNMGNEGSSVESRNQLTRATSGFTQYPSQGGAFFQWAGISAFEERRAYHPVVPIDDISNWNLGEIYPPNFWAPNNDLSETRPGLMDANELCPSGYNLSDGTRTDFRRPNDGSITGISSGFDYSSETRQSLLLESIDGGHQSINGTTLWGYYADGFFDRRQINSETLGTNGAKYSTVSVKPSNYSYDRNKFIAYIGRLYYSKYNHTSLFFPAMGVRSEYSGTSSGILSAGAFGGYWTSSLNSMNGATVLSPSLKSHGMAAVFTYYGLPVRCVRDQPYVPEFIEPESRARRVK